MIIISEFIIKGRYGLSPYLSFILTLVKMDRDAYFAVILFVILIVSWIVAMTFKG